jgi:hypothetical protein
LIAFPYGGDVTVSATLLGLINLESVLLSAQTTSLMVNFFFNIFVVTMRALKLLNGDTNN